MLVVAIDIPRNIQVMPICAVDLGFSETNASVGIASTVACGAPPSTAPAAAERGSYDFAAAKDALNEWISRAHDACHGAPHCCNEALLIVEAPLSMATTKLGNPCHRNVELQRNYEVHASPRSPKGWYYQAGANLCLGSTLLLRALTVPENVTLHLVEGFYCSISPDEGHANDVDVAVRLLEHVRSSKAKLIMPSAETSDGTVVPLPGLDGVFGGRVPGILLRPELILKKQTSDRASKPT